MISNIGIISEILTESAFTEDIEMQDILMEMAALTEATSEDEQKKTIIKLHDKTKKMVEEMRILKKHKVPDDVIVKKAFDLSKFMQYVFSIAFGLFFTKGLPINPIIVVAIEIISTAIINMTVPQRDKLMFDLQRDEKVVTKAMIKAKQNGDEHAVAELEKLKKVIENGILKCQGKKVDESESEKS